MFGNGKHATHYARARQGEPAVLIPVIWQRGGSIMQREPEEYRPFDSGYVSEFSQFLNGFMAAHPEVEEDRRRGWRIWWDRHVDHDALARERTDTLPFRAVLHD
jgi:hypothetical protein